MSKVDVVLLLILLFGAYNGYRKGFISEVIFLIATVLGVLAAFHFSSDAGAWLNEKFNFNIEFLPFVGFFLVFIAVIILVSLLGKIVKTSVDKTVLGDFDNAFGAILGTIKWAFLISVFLWIANFLDLESSKNWAEESWLVPYIEGIAPFTAEMAGLVFPGLKDLFAP